MRQDCAWLPRWAANERVGGLVLRLGRFGVVGVIGFCIDTAVVYGLRHALGLYGAGMVSYLVAASCNWALNRIWTFADRPKAAIRKQWGLFMLANLIGFGLNRGCYMVMIATLPICTIHPVIAVAGGAVAGMGVNFLMSHRVVFR